MDRSIPRPPTQEEVDTLVRIASTQSISKPTLQSLCVLNGLPKTGNKIDLQRRLTKLIQDSAHDGPEFYEIQQGIHTKTGLPIPAPRAQPPPPPAQTQTSYYPTASPRAPTTHYAMPAYNPPGTYLPTSNGIRPAPGSISYNQQQSTPSPSPVTWPRSNLILTTLAEGFTYKRSPFHEILCRLGDLKTLMPQHRNTVTISLKAQDNSYLQQCATDPRYRVMIFCAGANTGEQDIVFPHPSELKVNGADIKANMRGLKNKPGSTRPVDITPSLRLKPPSYSNTVAFTYAMTNKKYYFGVYVCKTTPVEELVTRIKKKIPKNTVINDIAKKASDPDVVATSQNISLKCPLSYMRLKNPCRSISCSHIQCFDATSYLQLQEQGPQWVCPICNKSATYDQLAIDEYVMDIINGTPESVEQATIEPNGNWVLPGGARKSTRSESVGLLDDEDFCISDMFATPTASASTPRAPGGSVTSGARNYLDTPSNNGSRGSSAVPKSTASSNKRPVSEVIDLTLSDDDEPPRPAKRANYGAAAYENYH
ncbi:E3 SUMO-protein ligase pli1 [Naviculisporaceae sp. PSN 640]